MKTLTLSLLLALVSATSLPAAGDAGPGSGSTTEPVPAKPLVGGEILVAPEAGTSKLQFRPAAAFNGEVYLVVWQDGVGTVGSKECEIWATRLDKAGKPLDDKGIQICKSEGKEMRKSPVVAPCGKDFLVVWEDYRNAKDYDVYGARVTGEGKVLDPNGFVISGEPGVQITPSVASDGKTGWLAAWSDFRNGKDYDIYAARISTDGKVVDSSGMPIATGQGRVTAQWFPSVVWGDGAYLLSYRISGFMYLLRVTQDGKIANALDEAAKVETKCFNESRGAAPGAIYNNGQSDDRADIFSGRTGCLAVTVREFGGKGGAWAGGVQLFGYLLGLDGKPRPSTVEVFRKGPLSTACEVRPIWMDVKTEGVWHPCAGALGNDFLVVAQRRKKAAHGTEDGIVACRVQMNGVSPDFKTGWIILDETPGYNKAYPNACGGPENSCLVVYERDKARDDHKISARMVKRN